MDDETRELYRKQVKEVNMWLKETIDSHLKKKDWTRKDLSRSIHKSYFGVSEEWGYEILSQMANGMFFHNYFPIDRVDFNSVNSKLGKLSAFLWYLNVEDDNPLLMTTRAAFWDDRFEFEFPQYDDLGVPSLENIIDDLNPDSREELHRVAYNMFVNQRYG